MAEADTTAFVITDDQVDFFHAFGYLKLPGLFKNEISQLAACFDKQFAEHPDEIIKVVNSTHYNAERKALLNMPDRDPRLFSLLGDIRVQTIGHRLLGGDFNYLPSEGNIFSGDTAWHTDEYTPAIQIPKQYTYFKLALYLDPMPIGQGAFRVVPGSHHVNSRFTQAMRKHLSEDQTLFGMPAEEIPATLISSEPGDALIFDHRIQHATHGTQHARRMLYFGLAQRYSEADDDIRKKTAENLIKHYGCIYREPLASTDDPVIRRCIEQLSDL